jgi:Zn-dependent protease with chaperone function
MDFSSRSSHVLAVLLALLIASPAWMWAAVGTSPTLPDPGLAAPKDQQEQLGQKAVAEVYKQMPILPDSSPTTIYVASLGRKLQAVIPQQHNWPYEFHVVQESDINAFALPGGPIFVNLGTINAADNEAELAGVLAHEMSHVYMQHSIKAMQKQGTTQAAGQILGGILGAVLGGTAGALANLGAQVGAGVISMKYSRADEAQADAIGAIIMYKAGYNPVYIAQFFQKLEKEGASGPQFLSDHPNPGNRVAAVEAEIKNWPPQNYRNDTPQFAQAKQQAAGVKAYTAQQIQQMAQSGQIHNTSVPPGTSGGQAAPGGTMGDVTTQQVMPSGRYQQYQQGGISIDYPSNWQVMPSQQQSGGLLIAPQAAVSQTGIAYGVLINAAQPQNATSLDDATNQLIASIVQSNPGMQQAGSRQNIQVNGIPSKSVDLMGVSPIQGPDGQPLQEHDWLVTLPSGNGQVVYLIFIAPQRDFSRLRPTFEYMLRMFHFEGDYLRLPGGNATTYQSSLQILRAEYGAGNRFSDVTARLNSQIQGDQLNLQVTNDTMGGDPAQDQEKTLRIQYVYNGRQGQMVVNEGDYLSLPANALPGRR